MRPVVLVLGTLVWIGGIVVASQPGARPVPRKPSPTPSWAQVKQTITAYFRALPGYQPGDIITQEEAVDLDRQLARIGWTLADHRDILAAVPASDTFLVQQLRSPGGRKFMRRIASYPGVYDRLDRLSSLPHGKRTIEDLIRGPGGDRMLGYLTSTSGGKEMGKMLSNAPGGEDFNKPTGRIYTAEMLLAACERAYTSKRQGKGASPASNQRAR